ncbi:MAG: hypothetical protein L6R38_003515 [Xanthoria sp. 2 TBL-2021]|nr:MAG: hypothetical protein L6R38_003515 [Xanthoria sp. 2 TBL-2021]
MYFSTTLALFSTLAVSSAFPTHPSYTRLFPRGNETDECRDGSDVARGGKLDAEAAAEAHQRDGTATRAFSAISIKASDGNCLTIAPCGGDFRQNLIPVQTKACALNSTDPTFKQQKFDIITKGKHIHQEGGMLVVSALTQGCVTFDPRRKVDDQVNIFSCGGRAAGEGDETDSQIFPFTAGQTTFPLAVGKDAKTCLATAGGKVGPGGCGGKASQVFTLG